MANINSIKFKDRKIFLNIGISREEYTSLTDEKNLMIFPASSFDMMLVTGTLGNSNRIMLPNKILKRNNIEKLVKNAPSKIVKTKKGKYLIIQLEGPEDVPKFNVASLHSNNKSD
jgi:hypothetical protein